MNANTLIGEIWKVSKAEVLWEGTTVQYDVKYMSMVTYETDAWVNKHEVAIITTVNIIIVDQWEWE